MAQCSQCGAVATPDDRFCGECGTEIAAAAPAAAEVPQPSPTPAALTAHGEPKSSPAKPSIWLIAGLVLGAIVTAGLVKLGGDYFTSSDAPAANPQLVEAGQQTPEPEPEKVEPEAVAKEAPKATETANKEPDESDAMDDTLDDVAEDAMAAAEEAALATAPPIAAGLWRFDWRITNIAGDGQSRPITARSLLPIGKTGVHEFCVSPQAAQSPRSIAFPIHPGARCRANQYAVGDNNIDGVFTCQFTGKFGAVEMSLTGENRRNAFDGILRLFGPVQMIVPNSPERERTHTFYNYRGRRVGSC